MLSNVHIINTSVLGDHNEKKLPQPSSAARNDIKQRYLSSSPFDDFDNVNNATSTCSNVNDSSNNYKNSSSSQNLSTSMSTSIASSLISANPLLSDKSSSSSSSSTTFSSLLQKNHNKSSPLSSSISSPISLYCSSSSTTTPPSSQPSILDSSSEIITISVTDTKTDLISSSRADKIPNNASVNYSNDIEKNDQTRSLQPPSSTKEEIITKEITINFNDTGSENNNNNSVIVENTDGNNKNRISLSPSSTSSSSTITALSSSSSTNSIINQTTDPSLPVNSTTDQQQPTVTDSKSVRGSSNIASTTDDSNKNVNGANNHNVFDPSIGNHSNSSSSPNVSDNNKTEAIDENIVPTDYNSSSSNLLTPPTKKIPMLFVTQQNQINNQDNNQTTAAASENHSFVKYNDQLQKSQKRNSKGYNDDSINGNNKVYKEKSFDQLYKDKQISASSWKEKTNTNSSATSSKNKISQSPSDNTTTNHDNSNYIYNNTNWGNQTQWYSPFNSGFNIELSRPKSPKGTNTRSHTPSRINNNNEGNTSLFSTSDHISLLQIGGKS
nr:13178_t:CDS:2 [Entrophospora candida]